MNTQTVCALTLVAICAVYLTQRGIVAVRDFFRKKSEGCGPGCAKCAFAQPGGAKPMRAASTKSANIIPLSSVRLPKTDTDDVMANSATLSPSPSPNLGSHLTRDV